MKSHLPEEILIEIFSRLPLKSLHKFKWLSKSWSNLITHQVIPRILSSPLLGFFYRISGCHITGDLTDENGIFTYITAANINAHNATKIDTTLSFLRRPSKLAGCNGLTFSLTPEISILDCCNGLVLCRSKEHYFVCNPATKSWTKFTRIVYPCYILLDFDPGISLHYKLVTITMYRNLHVLINIYYSETRRWEGKRVDCGVRIFPCVGSNVYSALWNGAVYLYASCRNLDSVLFDQNFKIIRFGLLEGDIDHEFIEFPTGTEMPKQMACIGRLGNKLRLACLDGQQLRVWMFQGKHEKQWVMEHDSTICRPSGYDLEFPPRVVGFHPSLDAVLIEFGNVFYAYDLKKTSLAEICQIRSESIRVDSASLFPFSPCSFDLLEHQNDS